MLATLTSGALLGIEAFPVHVEVNTGEVGEPRLILVGLPDTAVKESQDRVYSALANSGFKLPRTRTTLNLAPGNIRKEGPLYDLPIALGLLAATQQLTPSTLDPYLVAGELALSGKTRAIKGGLALAILARQLGKKGIILPKAAAEEAVLVEDLPVYAVDSLDHCVRFLKDEITLPPLSFHDSPYAQTAASPDLLDFSEIKGQTAVRRAVEVAVAGAHNLLMIGPPGSGKSMIAKRIPTIMSPPNLDEFLEILSVHSAAGITLSGEQKSRIRPFRSPHHTISDVGLLGGGSVPGPGEISLAHQGILFMDELPEFRRSALEVLRQPLEDNQVTISRSAAKVTLPASFMLVAAMNPCPCGYLGDPKRECKCSPREIERYRNRLSGPLLDRIDIHIEAPAVSLEELRTAAPSENSHSIKERITEARNRQTHRNHTPNARLTPQGLEKFCQLSSTQTKLLEQAMNSLSLSARAYTRILKVARTIADLDNSPDIQDQHLFEAIHYRTLDRSSL